MAQLQSTLTPDQLEQIREELQRTLCRIERSLKNNGNGRPDLDQSAVGRLSRIEALQNQGLTQGLHDRERVQLEQVMSALGRLDQGTYGHCTSCQVPIRFERLLVFPETPACSDCGNGERRRTGS